VTCGAVGRVLRVLGVAMLCVLAGACSSGGKKSEATSSSAPTRTTTTTTSVPDIGRGGGASSTTLPPDTIASGSCTGEIAFGETAGEWANAKLSTPTEFTVTRFSRSTANPSWARALLVPDAHVDSIWVVARCDGTQWKVVDGGTSRVGCTGGVPADLGVECK
jgi:hypothetical protein